MRSGSIKALLTSVAINKFGGRRRRKVKRIIYIRTLTLLPAGTRLAGARTRLTDMQRVHHQTVSPKIGQ